MIFLLFHHSYSPWWCFSDQKFFVFLSPIWEHHESTNQAVSHPLLASCDGCLQLLQDSESLERNNENRYCKRLCQIFCIFVNIWLLVALARYGESWKECWELIRSEHDDEHSLDDDDKSSLERSSENRWDQVWWEQMRFHLSTGGPPNMEQGEVEKQSRARDASPKNWRKKVYEL